MRIKPHIQILIILSTINLMACSTQRSLTPQDFVIPSGSSESVDSTATTKAAPSTGEQASGYVAFTINFHKRNYVSNARVALSVEPLSGSGQSATFEILTPDETPPAEGKNFYSIPSVFWLKPGKYKLKSAVIHIPPHRQASTQYPDINMDLHIEDRLPTINVEPETLTHYGSLGLSLQEAKSKTEHMVYYTYNYSFFSIKPWSKAWRPWKSIINRFDAHYFQQPNKNPQTSDPEKFESKLWKIDDGKEGELQPESESPVDA
jgi:hypothetical protein